MEEESFFLFASRIFVLDPDLFFSPVSSLPFSPLQTKKNRRQRRHRDLQGDARVEEVAAREQYERAEQC